MEANPKKLKLSNCKVLFYNAPGSEDAKKYGQTFTIDLSEEQREYIRDFWKTNNVGKSSNPNRGTANIKEYTNPKTGETTHQLTLKYTDKTQWAGKDGLCQDDMGFGAVINLIGNAYDYTDYSGGTAVGISAVVLTKGATKGTESALDELMSDIGEEITEDVDAPVVPF